MKSCPICYEDKEDIAFMQLDCKHHFCRDCIFQIIPKQLDVDEEANLSCPMCRNVLKVDEVFIQRHEIPVTCFNAETAILVDHVKTFFESNEATETYQHIRNRQYNFRRAILQDNIKLIKYWLNQIHPLMTTCQVDYWKGLQLALRSASSNICHVLLQFASKMDDKDTRSIVLEYLCNIMDSEKFATNLTKINILLPVCKNMDALQIQDVLISFSTSNMINALEWWADHGLQIHANFTKLYVVHSVQILNWWKEHDPLFVRSLTRSSLQNITNVEVLKWWKCNGQPFRYSDEVLFSAITQKKLDTLKWWYESGLEFPLNSLLYKTAVSTGDINIVQWVKEHWTDPKEISSFNTITMVMCCDENYLDVFKYILSITDDPDTVPCCFIVDHISRKGRVEMMQYLHDWCQSHDRPFLYNEPALDWASVCGHLQMVKWWFNSGLPLRYTEYAIDFALYEGHFDIVEYWQTKKDDIALKFSVGMFVDDDDDDEKLEKLLNWLSSDNCKLSLDQVILSRIDKIRERQAENSKILKNRRAQYDIIFNL